MSDAQLHRRAGVAIRIAFRDDAAAQRQLEDYLDEMTGDDLDALYLAAQAVCDTVSYVLGRRHT